MPDTLDQRFVDEFITRLKLISTTLPNLNGFVTNPKLVADWRDAPLNADELPALIVRDLETDQDAKRPESGSSKQYNVLYIQVQIECYDIKLVRLLVADVWKAVSIDPEWGYKAINTRPLKVRRAVNQEGLKVIGALVDFAIDYISNKFDAYE